jgi:hypothetical protein
MQGEEDPRTAARASLPPLPLPSPEQFGLGQQGRRQEIDWADLRGKLEALSISSFHLQKIDGGFRFTCMVPAPNGKRNKVEAEAEFESDAIEQALTLAQRPR